MDKKGYAELQLRNFASVVDNLSPADVPNSVSAVDRIRAAIAECQEEHRGELLASLECIVVKLTNLRDVKNASGQA